ncbi:polysaccharide deacetylase family protein [Chenggangzhangella methanolivorans]|uniref:polysaccharide deacetylase family protein n=1 Tax=Chenggangzhangella methanolivorans TaxID=1437009 RepID=UPI00361C39F8
MIEKLDDLYGRATNKALRLRAYRPAIVATATPIVSFTFDDVPDTALTAGARILEAHGVRGSFYIAGGLAGRVEPGRTLIDLDGCRELAARGHEIGCHTYAHDAVRRLGPSALAADLDRNAAYLAEIEGARARRNFAFPYNAGSIPALPELGRRYRTCRAAGDRINRGPTDLNFLNAVEIRQPEESALALTARIEEVAREPGWLIFFTHDVAETPTDYGCRPETLDRLVGHAVAKGCVVETVDAALNRLGLAA